MSSETGPVAVNTLRTCNHCHKGPPTGQKLRKCAACSGTIATVYCGRECQKKAWPQHKYICRYTSTNMQHYGSTMDEQVQTLGYPSSEAFAQAFSDYVDAHQWALVHGIMAQILLRCGPTMDIADPDKNPLFETLRIRFRLKPSQATPRSQRSPAHAFSLVEWRFCSIMEQTPFSRIKATLDVLDLYKTEHDRHLARGNPFYVGIMLMVYAVEGVSVDTARFMPVFRLNPDLALTDAIKVDLGDFIQICANSINAGLPLRVVDMDRPTHPVPGRIVREGEEWIWKPFFKDWSEYQQGRAPCSPLAMLEGLPSGRAALTSFDVFDRFWWV
ncbi:hypothetical protein C2E23DRAFT_281415 [Lenzites betulinus]|nr:hypothetical protein C2E23DRAFT_281415 [Lenzites betulinus]